MKASVFTALLAAVAVGGHVDAAFARYLTIGSTGTDVAELQTILETNGYLVMPAGVAKGYFGALTKNAVVKWQAAVGLPATGYFGPMSILKIGMTGSTSNGNGNGSTVPADNGGLKGGDGDFKSYKVLGSPSNQTVDEGASKNVFGFEFEADNSDLRVERLQVQVTGNGNTAKPWKYIDSLELYNGSKKVATVDASSASDWDEQDNDVYEIEFSKINSIIKENQKAKFYINVVAKDSIKDSDLPLNLTMFISDDGLRAVNAEKINVYEGRESQTKNFTIDTVDAGDINVTVDSTDNKDRDVAVEENDTTEDVVLYTAQIESKDSDNTINEVTVNLASLDSTNLSRMITNLYLYIDGEEVGSESVSGITDAVTFDDIDFDLSKNDEVDLEVRADVDEQEDNYANGSGAQVTGIAVDFTDSNDDDQTIVDTTDGGQVVFSVDALELTSNVTTSAKVYGNLENRGDYVISFKINAPKNSDIYIPNGAASSTATNTGAYFKILGSHNEQIQAGVSLAGLARKSGGSSTGNYYKISKGNSASFEVHVIVDNTGYGDRGVSVQLAGIDYNTRALDAGMRRVTAGFDETYRTSTVLLLDQDVR
ncbi:MAG: trimeric autotransporter adhesin, partial [Candidatus Parcubacteria bacterium]